MEMNASKIGKSTMEDFGFEETNEKVIQKLISRPDRKDFETLFALFAPDPKPPAERDEEEETLQEEKQVTVAAEIPMIGTFVPASIVSFWPAWLIAAMFIAIQLTCYFSTGDSFFGYLTGGVVESLRLSTGVPMTWHMMSGCIFWTLGGIQVLAKPLRHGRFVPIHRLLGVTTTFLWFFVCGPTAFWLSLHVGLGKAQSQFFMTMFAIAGMDTTIWAYYYMIRGWICIRKRRRGPDSVYLHGRLMRMGISMTMLILFQRPLQFLGICLRWVVLGCVSLLPSSSAKEYLQWFFEIVLDHNILLAITTMHPQTLLIAIMDGPRSEVGMVLIGVAHDSYEEIIDAFGNASPKWYEKAFWRFRYLAFLALRCYVTRGFGQDPVLLLGS
mmetsp:Transcript_89228/g.186481  ORF Transcript_89228/g.186481 Transcript_89228/m.186481 type:complete len:384 (-) Transcript_89228:13-1164(-)